MTLFAAQTYAATDIYSVQIFFNFFKILLSYFCFYFVAQVLASVSGCNRGVYTFLINDLCLANFTFNMENLDRGLWCSWKDTMEWVHWLEHAKGKKRMVGHKITNFPAWICTCKSKKIAIYRVTTSTQTLVNSRYCVLQSSLQMEQRL